MMYMDENVADRTLTYHWCDSLDESSIAAACLPSPINPLPKRQNFGQIQIDPLPHMPILDSSNSAANKDMMSEILTDMDTIF